MLNYKYSLVILISILASCFVGCKKYDTLPDLDQGNDFNPASGVEFVKLDSSRVYGSTTKTLKCYVGVKTALVNSNGFTVSRINVYKNGISGTYLTPPGNAFVILYVTTGQVFNFEFTVVDSQGRESKKSRVYHVVI